MARLQMFPVTVTADDGEIVPAEVVCCSVCGDPAETPTQWLALVIHGAPHLQCTHCGASYCEEGKCQSLCVACDERIREEDFVRTKRGPMHLDCAAHAGFPVDHGDSVYPR